jgi:hypothetical protein
VAELVDAPDLKSVVPKGTYLFDSDRGHHKFVQEENGETMETGNAEAKRATHISVGVAKDLSLVGLRVITEDGREQKFIFPPTAVRALHDQLGQILLKYPGLGGTMPSRDPASPGGPEETSAAKPALARQQEAPGPATRLRIYSLGPSPYKLAPASPSRAWMDKFPNRHPYRCLPMAIANAYGWEMLSPCAFAIDWTGGPEKSDITFRCLDNFPFLSHFALSHFTRGIATFHTGYIFRTDPGWNLMVTGPLNSPKAGIVPLSGVVETDWLPFSFTMNWQLTQPGTVTFEKDEPICLVYPVLQRALEETTPEIFNLADDPALKKEFEAWDEKRMNFLQRMDAGDPDAHKEGWQRVYFKGERPDGGAPPSHRIKMRLNAPVDRRK